ncbi:tRNA uridine-5-carboxymethylaminomethyl(34) synthesis GTPase MnmE [Prosthecomicrobium sp. N25]|uniref:tRNA uridine-5-carboxymethylaminomethyl(34) synthesis GTPase MnmE n=1 Tax=Prosthecomicrobium sp. N25 TaxID=3129254 RepID=UPI003077D61F
MQEDRAWGPGSHPGAAGYGEAVRAETIFAVSSGPVPSGVAVIRISGPHARFVAETMAGGLPPPRRASLRRIRARDGRLLDEGLVLWMPGPRSFTGEDMAELHVHGGRAVVAAVLEELGSLNGLRPAEAGDFSRRAFLNGRLDLTEIEGLADLIGAETEWQRRQAIRQADGALRRLYEGWRSEILALRGFAEAELDFADEADVPESVGAGLSEGAAVLASAIERHLADGHRGERLRAGFEVVLMGPPNAGKSSLLNALARREAAIVSTTPGTTRDLIEIHLDIGGWPVTLVDAAGVRVGGDAIEQEGIRRALTRASTADLVLWLDAADLPPSDPPADVDAEKVLRLVSKVDLSSDSKRGVSVETGAGLDDLLAAISERAAGQLLPGPEPALTRTRHRAALDTAASALRRASSVGLLPEFRAEELRHAGDALGRVTGVIAVDDVLDVIFSQFCIGK